MLSQDLLQFYHDEKWKIYVPEGLIGLLLARNHLLGHWGVDKSMKNLTDYYFPKMYTRVKRFVNSCYPCFLQNSSSRRNKLGIYPVPEYPFQEISMDLCENLNKVGGFSHLLIIQDVLSEYLTIFPLKSKTMNEMSRNLLYGFLQHFNVQRIHTDNGPLFRHNIWLKLMATLNIKIIDSSSLNPQARGKAERAVGIVKTLLKKILATSTSKTLNWENLPYLVSKIINSSVVPRTGVTPYTMVYGNNLLSRNFMAMDPLFPVHHNIKNHSSAVEALTKELNTLAETAKETLAHQKEIAINYKNVNRIEKKFNKNDLVFVIDTYNLPGNSRPLKTKFYPSPCVVIRQLHTTTLIQRIADGFKALYSNDHIKKFSEIDKTYLKLPKEVLRILLNDVKDFLSSDFELITKHDPFSLEQILQGIDNSGTDLPDTVDPSFVSRKRREGEQLVPAPKLNDLDEDIEADIDEELNDSNKLATLPTADNLDTPTANPELIKTSLMEENDSNDSNAPLEESKQSLPTIYEDLNEES